MTESDRCTMGKFSQKILDSVLPRAKIKWVKEILIPKNNY
jgi:hypothetical protein